MSELVYLSPFLIALALLMLIASGSDGTSYARAGTFSHASADYLARAMRLRSVLVLAVIGALIAYNTVNENMRSMMEFSSPIYIPVTIMGGRAVMHANPWLVERSRRRGIPRATL